MQCPKCNRICDCPEMPEKTGDNGPTNTVNLTATSGDLTKFLDNYFDARPQLKRPSKNLMGYQVQSEFLPVLQSLFRANLSKKNDN